MAVSGRGRRLVEGFRKILLGILVLEAGRVEYDEMEPTRAGVRVVVESSGLLLLVLGIVVLIDSETLVEAKEEEVVVVVVVVAGTLVRAVIGFSKSPLPEDVRPN